MYDNIGDKIKILAKVVFWIEAITAVICGLGFAGMTNGMSLLIGLGIALVALIFSWFLYGFGEIIDKLCAIERNTRSNSNKTVFKPTVSPNKINKLDKLLEQGLITEEEYNQATTQQPKEV